MGLCSLRFDSSMDLVDFENSLGTTRHEERRVVGIANRRVKHYRWRSNGPEPSNVQQRTSEIPAGAR